MPANEKPWVPDARPWREHHGGPCPIAGDELCEVLLRYRRYTRSAPDLEPYHAWDWNWEWGGKPDEGNIVAYLTKADADAWEAAQKAKAADEPRPLAVGDLVKHGAPGSPVMRVAWVRAAAKVGLDTVPPWLKAEWFTTDGAYQYIEAAPAEFVRAEK